MNKQQQAILRVMDSDRQRWWFRLDIVAASKGEVSRGAIYANMHDLKDEGLVESMCSSKLDGEKERKIAGRPPSVYRITRKGTGKKIEEGVKDKPRSLLDRLLPNPELA